MPADVDRRRPGDTFAAREDRPRHLEFVQAFGQRQQAVADVVAMGHIAQAVVEAEERIERAQPLIGEYGADSICQLIVDPLPQGCFAAALRADRRPHPGSSSALPAAAMIAALSEVRAASKSWVESVRWRKAEAPCPGIIELRDRNLSLPGEDLPHADFGLERAQCVRAQCDVGIPSTWSAVATKCAIAASSSSGKSEKMWIPVLNSGKRSASKCTVSSERRSRPACGCRWR